MKRIKVWAGLLCLVLLAGMMERTNDYIEARELQQEIAGKVLRFHVRANSDSEKDQRLKLKVRDAVGALMSEKMMQAKSLIQCEELVVETMAEIVDTAQTVIEEGGYHYPVEAYIANVQFPEKTYGAYTFPAGEYQALEVLIGAGAGQNWWCVMYPNMCFANSVYETADEKEAETLKASLTQEEYESLMEEKNYKIRFRYLKFLNQFLQ